MRRFHCFLLCMSAAALSGIYGNHISASIFYVAGMYFGVKPAEEERG